MKIKILLSIVLAVVCFVSTGAWAGNGSRKARPAKQVTDAAGRVHVRPRANITDAQRKAAAHHRKVVREKAAQAATKGEVKK